MNALLNIPVANIEENPVALREVDKESEKYLGIRDSIKKDGLLNAISVVAAFQADGKTPKLDNAGGLMYRVCDGAHRLSACRENGFETIPAQVLTKTDQEIMVAQLVANAHKVDTKPFQYSRHLAHILSNDPTMTIQILANTLSKSRAWLDDRLGLGNLNDEVGKLVDDGKITVTNAVDLAKLRPVDEQLKFVADAIADSPAVFGPKVKARIKEIRDAKAAGRDPSEAGKFAPNAHSRKMSELKAELDSNAASLVAAMKAAGITDVGQAAVFTLKWSQHLDEQSVAEQKARWDARQAQDEADKVKRAADRAAKKALEAKILAENLPKVTV